jgi:beta-lactamase superfamily II metal-dependent hydrolase
MKRFLAATAIAALTLAINPAWAAASPPANGMRIAWIDVEGGASTLFIAPSGESLLFDTGYEAGDRDAKRIFAAAQKAGLTKLDHVVISHWHGDHVGGLAALAKMIPIGHLYDHGDGVQPEDRARLEGYKTVAAGKRTILKPGDTIPFAGVNVQVVSAEGPLIDHPINGGGPNPYCANAAQMGPAAPENQRMVGLLITYNSFKLLSLADLDWQKEMELVCPVNKVGEVTVWTVSRHGGLDDSGAPPLIQAIKPKVIVINNGPRKGLGQTDERAKPLPGNYAPYEKNSYLRLAKLPGVEGIWQEHLSLIDKDPAHNTQPDMIANPEEGANDAGNPITATVSADGTFTLTNTRNNFSKTYSAR